MHSQSAKAKIRPQTIANIGKKSGTSRAHVPTSEVDTSKVTLAVPVPAQLRPSHSTPRPNRCPCLFNNKRNGTKVPMTGVLTSFAVITHQGEVHFILHLQVNSPPMKEVREGT